MYLDGVSVHTDVSTTGYDDVAPGAVLFIGDTGYPEYNFNGTIDEVRIWNRSLSADEIYQQYISNLNKYDPDKWALYVNQSLNASETLWNGTYTYQRSSC